MGTIRAAIGIAKSIQFLGGTSGVGINMLNRAIAQFEAEIGDNPEVELLLRQLKYVVIMCLGLFTVSCSRSQNIRTNHWNEISPNRTPLVDAILRNDRDRVKTLLDSGANPNQISSDGSDSHGNPIEVTTPLSWAVSELVVCDTQTSKCL